MFCIDKWKCMKNVTWKAQLDDFLFFHSKNFSEECFCQRTHKTYKRQEIFQLSSRSISRSICIFDCLSVLSQLLLHCSPKHISAATCHSLLIFIVLDCQIDLNESSLSLSLIGRNSKFSYSHWLKGDRKSMFIRVFTRNIGSLSILYVIPLITI